MTKTDDNPFAALMAITKRPETVFVAGAGSWLTDADGRRYLDFVQGWAVNCLGHAPAPLAEAIAAQAHRLINCSPAYYSGPMLELAEELTRAAGLGRVFFANSGAEANEGAIKLARKWGAVHKGGAHRILTTVNGFHGRTLATMAASGKPGWQDLFPPAMPGFSHVPFDDLEAMAAAIGPETVAVMVEPIQGEAGVIVPSPAYLTGLRTLTREHNILLILDEIQTGMGRTGHLFAGPGSGVTPDIMTLGKGLGGGAPLAALLARDDVCCFAPGDQGGTFNGNPLMMAAGLAVLAEITRDGFLGTVTETGAHLAAGLERLSRAHGLGAVRGQGLLLALDLKRDIGPELVAAAHQAGLLINAPRPDTLRLMPALNLSRDEADQGLAILDQVCANLA